MNSAPEEILSEFGEAAVNYARAGWHVFPLAAGSKVPTKGSAGFKDATRDESKIRMWWRNKPNANIGVACGATKLTVIDIDRHKADGFASVAEFERQHGALTATLTSITPNDGAHRIYFEPDYVPIKNDAAGELNLPGVDIRGTDGYIVAPPSVVDGKAYRWANRLEPASFPLSISCAIHGMGGRNDYLAKVISPRLRNNGMAGAALLAALQRVNAKFPEPLPESDVRKIAASADRNYDASRPELRITDESNGQRLFEIIGQNIHWVWQKKCFAHWDGRWVLDKSDARIMKLAKQALRCIYDEVRSDEIPDKVKVALLKHALKSKNRAPLRDAIEMLKSEGDVTIDAEQLDADPMLLGVKNGTVDLRTGEFRPGIRRDLITMSAGCSFDPGATCPRFDQFLDETFPSDAQMIEWAWRVIGYLLTGRCDDQIFLFFWGAGGNGKGVLCLTLAALLGEYAETMSTTIVVDSGKPIANANTPEIAKLRRKRLVLVPEVPEGARLNAAQVKNLTGSDLITGTAKFEHPITFAPTHKFIMYGNHEPAINSDDYGIVRRAMMVPFTRRYERGTAQCDPGLVDKLLTELPGILNRAIAGCLAWQQRNTHVDRPGAVAAKTDAWINDQPTFDDFINDCCALGDSYCAMRNVLFAAYNSWRKGQSGTGLNPGEFKRKLAAIPGVMVDVSKRADGKSPRKMVTGIGISPGWGAQVEDGVQAGSQPPAEEVPHDSPF